MERDLASHTTPRRRGGLPSFYVALWVVLSSMALTYLGMQYVRPDLAEGLGHQFAALAGVEARPAETQPSRDEPAVAEISELRRELEKAQRDVEAMRQLITARDERDRAVAERLAAIEAQKVAEPTSPLATASVTHGPGHRTESGHESTPGRISVEGPLSEPPARQARPPREQERIVLGPVQVKPSPAPANEPTGPRGIQIATGPSVDALRISWMLLSERHKQILKRYEPRFVPSNAGSGPAYRLIAGPISNTSAANRVCTELRARRVTCGVSAFAGEPL